MEKIWKDIKGYEGYYRVSNFGEVLGIKRNKILKPCVVNVGTDYQTLSVNLSTPINKKSHQIKKIVHETFIGECKGMIDHKDGDYTNCSVYNIVCVDKTFKFSKGVSKRIIDTETFKVYESISDLSVSLGLSYKAVSDGIKRGKKYSKYKFI